MSVLEHCHECNGSGRMGLDRGQYTEYVTCMYCKGTGDFQERRSRSRRSTDQGAVKALERLLAEIEGRPEGWQGPGTVQDFTRDALRDARELEESIMTAVEELRALLDAADEEARSQFEPSDRLREAILRADAWLTTKAADHGAVTALRELHEASAPFVRMDGGPRSERLRKARLDASAYLGGR